MFVFTFYRIAGCTRKYGEHWKYALNTKINLRNKKKQ